MAQVIHCSHWFCSHSPHWAPFSPPLPALASLPFPTAGPPSRCFASFRMSLSSPPGGVTCAESLLSLWLSSAWMAWSTGPPSALPTAPSYSHHYRRHYRRHRLAEEWEELQEAGGMGRQGAATRMTFCWRPSIRNSRGLTSISSCRTRRRGRRRGLSGYSALQPLDDSLSHHWIILSPLMSHWVTTKS